MKDKGGIQVAQLTEQNMHCLWVKRGPSCSNQDAELGTELHPFPPGCLSPLWVPHIHNPHPQPWAIFPQPCSYTSHCLLDTAVWPTPLQVTLKYVSNWPLPLLKLSSQGSSFQCGHSPLTQAADPEVVSLPPPPVSLEPSWVFIPNTPVLVFVTVPSLLCDLISSYVNYCSNLPIDLRIHSKNDHKHWALMYQPGTVLHAVCSLFHFNLATDLPGWYCSYQAHFTEEKSEALRGSVARPSPHTQ